MKEAKIQAQIHTWCYERGIKWAAIPNATFTSSWHAINQNKLLGVQRGVPDFMCIIPSKYRRDNMAMLIFIELKTAKGKPSKEQLEWIESLQECDGVNAAICYGYDDCIEYLSSCLELVPIIPETTEAEREEFIHNL